MGNKGSVAGGSSGSSSSFSMPSEEELNALKPAGRKGWELRKQAWAKMNSRSFRRDERLEQAAELAEKAATQFKLAKMYELAAESYKMQADACTRAKETMQASGALIKSAEMYGKSGGCVEEAVEVYSNAIEAYKEAGKFDRAAKQQQALATLLKKDSQFARAGQAFEEAADYFEMDGKSDSSARKCKEELALILAEDEDSLSRAAELFQEIAESCMEKSIAKFHAKGFFQKCVLCHLALGDTVGANEAADNATMRDPRFPQGREGQLVLNLVELCSRADDVTAFQSALKAYDDVTALGNWETAILIKIKRKFFHKGDYAIEDDPGPFGEPEEEEEHGDLL